jgi:hypothetical protein
MITLIVNPVMMLPNYNKEEVDEKLSHTSMDHAWEKT